MSIKQMSLGHSLDWGLGAMREKVKVNPHISSLGNRGDWEIKKSMK